MGRKLKQDLRETVDLSHPLDLRTGEPYRDDQTPPSLFDDPSLFQSKSKKRRAKKIAQTRGNTVIGKDGKTYRRVKTGNWYPVRLSWMSDGIFSNILKMTQYAKKEMSSDIRRASVGQILYGTRRRRDGYGNGFLQKWADHMVREGKNPHVLDLNKAPVAVKRAYDFWNDGDFGELFNRAQEDPLYHMNGVIERIWDEIPGVDNMTKGEAILEIQRRFYTLQFGPDGYAEPWDDANRCPKEFD